MRKTLPVLIVLFVLGSGIYLIFNAKDEQQPEKPSPEISNVGNHQVTIIWQSIKEYTGKVFYKTADSNAAPLSAI